MRYIVLQFEYVSAVLTAVLSHCFSYVVLLVLSRLFHQEPNDIRRNVPHPKEVCGIAQL